MKLLVIIPYRNRQDHLSQIIPYLNNILNDQEIVYKSVVVEQFDTNLFNRGLLCNIGFDTFYYDFDYVCFHDVDMMCSNIDYSFCASPVCLVKHRTKNKNVYDKYFGGIVLFPNELFIKVNGFSNKYWGWGAEDDDLYKRCEIKNIKTHRRNADCVDLELVTNNTNRKNNPNYKKNLQYLYDNKTSDSIMIDGLSTVKNCYDVISINEISENYIHMKVNLWNTQST
jgi:hypothetical protein